MTAASGKQALANADQWTGYDVGYCLRWVRGACWELGSFYGSAIEAWNGAKWKHPGDRHPPVGAPLFYSGGAYGHVVIGRGDTGRMRSTDCPTAGRVSNEDLEWPERAWGYTYIGWTEDLNGVRLPLDLGGEDDEEMTHYDAAQRATDFHLEPEEWRSIAWETIHGEDAFTEGAAYVAIGGRDYSAVLHLTVDAPEGSTIRMRTSEWREGTAEEWNPQTEAIATAGSTYTTHTHIGRVKADRVLRFEVACSDPAHVLAAQAVILSWG